MAQRSMMPPSTSSVEVVQTRRAVLLRCRSSSMRGRASDGVGRRAWHRSGRREKSTVVHAPITSSLCLCLCRLQTAAIVRTDRVTAVKGSLTVQLARPLCPSFHCSSDASPVCQCHTGAVRAAIADRTQRSGTDAERQCRESSCCTAHRRRSVAQQAWINEPQLRCLLRSVRWF